MSVYWFLLAASFLLSSCSASVVQKTTEWQVQRTGGIDLPIYRHKTRSFRRRGSTGSIGLGDSVDITYNVLMTVGGSSMPVVLDTGSADLWVLSDGCMTCSGAVALYRQATFKSADLSVKLLYGDSLTGTHAYGLIGTDDVGIASFMLRDQYFAAINDTNTSVEETGSAGIFGLGFPTNSVIWSTVFHNERSSSELASGEHRTGDDDNSKSGRLNAPNNSSLYLPPTGQAHQPREISPESIPDVFRSYATITPFLVRLVVSNALSLPMFTIMLQRDTVAVGGNVGSLNIGTLPGGVKNESLTWVPVRLYASTQGGLPPPSDSLMEQYPIAWEVFIEDVYLDGEKLPRSTLSSTSIALSALMDTGNSLIRGPADVLQVIQSRLGPQFPCSEPHTLAFQIQGKMFPVDPRDFVDQYEDNDECTSNLQQADPPDSRTGYLYSWSLGDPFLKSVVSAFYYGNLTYPSHDPPRMGFLSTVPSDANDRMRAAAGDAKDGRFPAVSETAPAGPPASSHTNSEGVPEVNPTEAIGPVKTSAARRSTRAAWVWASAMGLTGIFVM